VRKGAFVLAVHFRAQATDGWKGISGGKRRGAQIGPQSHSHTQAAHHGRTHRWCFPGRNIVRFGEQVKAPELDVK
jgi:hypothetical protein